MAVAFSGGRDSTALLHATVRAAADLGLRVLALHVHHGLMPEADAWLVHAKAQCRRWAAKGLPLTFLHRRVQGRPAAGDSVEAWARRERYRALAEMAREAGADLVLLAHHRRDQAETFVLQALRGAGPAGLAAMPAQAQRDGMAWARPWLGHSAEALAAYVKRHRLTHIDDGSNTDPRFARNRLRLAVWPALLEAFPQAEAALGLAALRAQDADAALDELAQADLAAMGLRRPLAAEARSALPVADWLTLSHARRVNTLRAWLSTQLPHGAPQALVQRLMDDLPQCEAAQWPAGEGFDCVLYRGRLRCQPQARTKAPAVVVPLPQPLDLSRPGEHPLPDWGGRWVVKTVKQGGVAVALLRACEVRERQGGEQFQLQARGTARALKKQYQALAVPAGARGGPLLWRGEQLLFVPGLGLDARCLAAPGQAQRSLRWVPDTAAP
ncbi:tRNA(Ile)-lysidine synthetase [Burkholderiales bacterium JOSHI_001]|nr:tRNA(Ile)-lysidine synthetase [Burkholderiales bacterium JOSHI_001]